MPSQLHTITIVGIVLGAASWLFYAKAGCETKKRMHPFIVIASGILFLDVLRTVGSLDRFDIIATCVVMAFNIFLTRFCPACGATYQVWFARSKVCKKCGAELT